MKDRNKNPKSKYYQYYQINPKSQIPSAPRPGEEEPRINTNEHECQERQDIRADSCEFVVKKGEGGGFSNTKTEILNTKQSRNSKFEMPHPPQDEDDHEDTEQRIYRIIE